MFSFGVTLLRCITNRPACIYAPDFITLCTHVRLALPAAAGRIATADSSPSRVRATAAQWAALSDADVSPCTWEGPVLEGLGYIALRCTDPDAGLRPIMPEVLFFWGWGWGGICYIRICLTIVGITRDVIKPM